MTLETAKMLREDFLQQNAFVEEDAYTPLPRQARLLELILSWDALCRAAQTQGAALRDLLALPAGRHWGELRWRRRTDGRARMMRWKSK